MKIFTIIVVLSIVLLVVISCDGWDNGDWDWVYATPTPFSSPVFTP